MVFMRWGDKRSDGVEIACGAFGRLYAGSCACGHGPSIHGIHSAGELGDGDGGNIRHAGYTLNCSSNGRNGGCFDVDSRWANTVIKEARYIRSDRASFEPEIGYKTASFVSVGGGCGGFHFGFFFADFVDHTGQYVDSTRHRWLDTFSGCGDMFVRVSQ